MPNAPRPIPNLKSKRMFEKSKKLLANLSPNLSPTRREAFKPPLSPREGGWGARGLQGFDVKDNTFKTSSKIQNPKSKI